MLALASAFTVFELREDFICAVDQIVAVFDRVSA